MYGRKLLFGRDLSVRECRQMLTDGKAITSRFTASMRTGAAASNRYIKHDYSGRNGGQLHNDVFAVC